MRDRIPGLKVVAGRRNPAEDTASEVDSNDRAALVAGEEATLPLQTAFSSRNALVIGGAVYGLGVFVVMRFAVVPFLDPVLLSLNTPAFAMAHLMWGAIVGLVLGWQTRGTAVLQQARA